MSLNKFRKSGMAHKVQRMRTSSIIWISSVTFMLLIAGCDFMERHSAYARYQRKVEEFDKILQKNSYPNSDILAIHGAENQDRLFISANGLGILMSQDQGQHWLKKMNGIMNQTKKVYAFAEDSQRGILYIATEQGVYKTTDYGENWISYSEGLSYESKTIVYQLDIDQNSGDLYALAGWDGYGIWKRGLADQEWLAIGHGLPEESIATSICFSPKENAIFISNGLGPVLVAKGFKYNMGVYKGTKITESEYKWENTGLPVNAKNEPVQNISFDPSTGNIFASGKKGTFQKDEQGWRKVLKQKYTYFSIFEKNGAKRGLLVSYNQIFLRQNEKGNWKILKKGWNEYATINSAAFYQGNIYIATNDGLYMSKDNGENWSLLTRELAQKIKP